MDLNEFLKLVKTPKFLLKVLQLAISITCVSTADQGLFSATNIHKATFLHMVYCGYIIILLMEISKLVFGDQSQRMLEMFWTATGMVMWTTAGSIDLEYYISLVKNYSSSYSYFSSTLTSSLLGLVNVFAFGAELGLLYRNR